MLEGSKTSRKSTVDLTGIIDGFVTLKLISKYSNISKLANKYHQKCFLILFPHPCQSDSKIVGDLRSAIANLKREF